MIQSAMFQYKHEYTFLTPSIGAWSEFTIHIVLIANVKTKEEVLVDGPQIFIHRNRLGRVNYIDCDRIKISEGVHNVAQQIREVL